MADCSGWFASEHLDSDGEPINEWSVAWEVDFEWSWHIPWRFWWDREYVHNFWLRFTDTIMDHYLDRPMTG